MSIDAAQFTIGNSVIIAALIGVMLWLRKELKDYFCKEIDDVKEAIKADRDRLAILLDRMLENDVGQIDRIASLEGRIGGAPFK